MLAGKAEANAEWKHLDCSICAATKAEAAAEIARLRGARSQTAQTAHDYVEGTTGCRNCGGFPHSDTCFVVVGRITITLALDSLTQTCATCRHYSGEHCADTRPHPMQHKVCPPTWGCPMREEATT